MLRVLFRKNHTLYIYIYIYFRYTFVYMFTFCVFFRGPWGVLLACRLAKRCGPFAPGTRYVFIYFHIWRICLYFTFLILLKRFFHKLINFIFSIIAFLRLFFLFFQKNFFRFYMSYLFLFFNDFLLIFYQKLRIPKM